MIKKSLNYCVLNFTNYKKKNDEKVKTVRKHCKYLKNLHYGGIRTTLLKHITITVIVKRKRELFKFLINSIS